MPTHISLKVANIKKPLPKLDVHVRLVQPDREVEEPLGRVRRAHQLDRAVDGQGVLVSLAG